MFDVRGALRALMLQSPDVNAAVGGNRVYPTLLPQGITAPSIVYQRISGFGDMASGGPTGLDRPRFQITAWAQSADSSSHLADLVRDQIDGFKGQIVYGSGSPQLQLIFRGIFFEIERDEYDDASKLFGTMRDYMVWFANR